MRKQVGIKLEEDLIARVDGARGGKSRTAFFEAALEAALGGCCPAQGSPGTDQRPADLAVIRAEVEELRALRRRDGVSVRAVSSLDAKRGVVPRWRGTDGGGAA